MSTMAPSRHDAPPPRVRSGTPWPAASSMAGVRTAAKVFVRWVSFQPFTTIMTQIWTLSPVAFGLASSVAVSGPLEPLPARHNHTHTHTPPISMCAKAGAVIVSYALFGPTFSWMTPVDGCALSTPTRLLRCCLAVAACYSSPGLLSLGRPGR